MFKKIMKITLITIAVLLVIASVLSSCFLQFRTSDRKAKKAFKDFSYQISFHDYKVGKRNIHYAEIGNDHLPTVIFIHGSPGSWNAFEGFLKDTSLLKKVHMISVDRPGYGYSDFGKKEESLEEQAAVYKSLLLKNKSSRKPILVGHSYGGPVIARMAIDYPDLISGLVFVAPSIDPDLEPKKWIQEPATWWVFRWMVPRALRVSNEEILALKNELKEMAPLLDKIHVPVVFIQGGKDPLVHPDNAKYAEEKFVNAPMKMVREPELNHFIPWTRPDLIKQGIIDLLDGKLIANGH
jgi:pimeloyl-ACP methyl ester carboxylesterase